MYYLNDSTNLIKIRITMTTATLIFIILSFCLLVLSAIYIVKYYCIKNSLLVISDEIPMRKDKDESVKEYHKRCALKLQDDIANFIEIDEQKNEIKLTIYVW